MTLEELILHSQQERCFGKCKVPELKKPIYHKDTLVGFYAPLKRQGELCIGFLYIGRPYRRKGIAYNFVKQWFQEHPNSNFYAININSINLALKVGLVQGRIDGKGNSVFVTKYYKNLKNTTT